MNKKEIKVLKRKLEEIKKYINNKCVYDEHLKGYCMGLEPGEVRTLMYIINKED